MYRLLFRFRENKIIPVFSFREIPMFYRDILNMK